MWNRNIFTLDCDGWSPVGPLPAEGEARPMTLSGGCVSPNIATPRHTEVGNTERTGASQYSAIPQSSDLRLTPHQRGLAQTCAIVGHHGRAQTCGVIPPMSNIGGIWLRPVAEPSGTPPRN